MSRGRVCVSKLSSTSQFMPFSSTGTVSIFAPASSITRYMSGCTGSSITTLPVSSAAISPATRSDVYTSREATPLPRE